MVALALALVSGVAWGFSDFFAGLRSRRLPVTTVVLLVVTGGAASSFVVALVGGPEWPGWPIVWPGVLAGVASLATFMMFYKALAIGPMSIVAPIGGMYPIVPVVVGLVLGERPGTIQFAGMVFVLAGVAAATYTSPGATTRRITKAAVLLAAGAALAGGVVLIGVERAAQQDPYWGIVLMRSTAAAGVAAYLAASRLRRRVRRREGGTESLTPGVDGGNGPGDSASPEMPGQSGSSQSPAALRLADVPALLGIGTLDTFATGLFGYAATLGYLSLIAVISSLFPLITVGLAKVFLGERVQPHQNVGVAAALAGAAMIAVG